MLIINCSKAAAEFFTKTQKGIKTSSIETAPEKTICYEQIKAKAPHEWQLFVHAIRVKGKHVLVVMDLQTRFSITLCGIKKGDHAGFLTMLEHHLIVHVDELMTKVDASPSAIEASLNRYENMHSSRTFYARSDRSVQTHVNDVVWYFRNHTDDLCAVPTGVELISQDVFVNQVLRTRKGEKKYFQPNLAFLQHWLINYANYTDEQAQEAIDLLRTRERASFTLEDSGFIGRFYNKEIDAIMAQSKPNPGQSDTKKKSPGMKIGDIDIKRLASQSSAAVPNKAQHRTKGKTVKSNVICLDTFRQKMLET